MSEKLLGASGKEHQMDRIGSLTAAIDARTKGRLLKGEKEEPLVVATPPGLGPEVEVPQGFRRGNLLQIYPIW